MTNKPKNLPREIVSGKKIPVKPTPDQIKRRKTPNPITVRG